MTQKIATHPYIARPAPSSISSIMRRASCSAKRSKAAPVGGPLRPSIRCRPVSDRSDRIRIPLALHNFGLPGSGLKPGRAVLSFHTSALRRRAPWIGSFTTRTSVTSESCSKQRRNEDKRAVLRKLLAEEEAREIPGSYVQPDNSRRALAGEMQAARRRRRV